MGLLDTIQNNPEMMMALGAGLLQGGSPGGTLGGGMQQAFQNAMVAGQNMRQNKLADLKMQEFKRQQAAREAARQGVLDYAGQQARTIESPVFKTGFNEQPATGLYAAGQPEKAKVLSLLAESDPNAALSLLGEQAFPEPTKSTYKVVPEMQESGLWRDLAVVNGKPAGYVGAPYSKSASASSVSVDATTKGLDKYAQERLKGEAAGMTELGKAAKSAYNESKALDRFISNSAKGTAGGAQPLITWTKNFLSSFGYSDDSLSSVAGMQQSIADMKVNKIAQFGARGLTDKDMEIIQQSLPRVDTSPEARIAVANVLKKLKDREIQDYIYARDEEARLYPDLSKKIRIPRWLSEYQKEKGKGQTDGMQPLNIPSGEMQPLPKGIEFLGFE